MPQTSATTGGGDSALYCSWHLLAPCSPHLDLGEPVVPTRPRRACVEVGEHAAPRTRQVLPARRTLRRWRACVEVGEHAAPRTRQVLPARRTLRRWRACVEVGEHAAPRTRQVLPARRTLGRRAVAACSETGVRLIGPVEEPPVRFTPVVVVLNEPTSWAIGPHAHSLSRVRPRGGLAPAIADGPTTSRRPSLSDWVRSTWTGRPAVVAATSW
jgi:hypothetical protein